MTKSRLATPAFPAAQEVLMVAEAPEAKRSSTAWLSGTVTSGLPLPASSVRAGTEPT